MLHNDESRLLRSGERHPPAIKDPKVWLEQQAGDWGQSVGARPLIASARA